MFYQRLDRLLISTGNLRRVLCQSVLMMLKRLLIRFNVSRSLRYSGL